MAFYEHDPCWPDVLSHDTDLCHDNELLPREAKLLDRFSKNRFGHAVRVAVCSVERGDAMLPPGIQEGGGVSTRGRSTYGQENARELAVLDRFLLWKDP